MSAPGSSPALNRANEVGKKLEDVLSRGAGAPLEERIEVIEKCFVGDAVSPASVSSELDLEAAAIGGMSHALDHLLLLELIDDAGHRAEPDVEIRRQRAHRLRAVLVEHAEAVGLRHGERVEGAFVEAAELIERGEGVQGVVEREHVGVAGHGRMLRLSYYTSQV